MLVVTKMFQIIAMEEMKKQEKVLKIIVKESIVKIVQKQAIL